MGASVAVTIVRPTRIDGGHVPPGTRLRVPALAAAELIDAGKAELASASDAAELERARAADRDAALRRVGRGEPPPAGWPWRPR
jgi:hypothetical protein